MELGDDFRVALIGALARDRSDPISLGNPHGRPLAALARARKLGRVTTIREGGLDF